MYHRAEVRTAVRPEFGPFSTSGLGMVMLRNAGLVLAGSAAIAVAAHVAIPLPFTPVPFTLQPLAVLLVALLLGPELGFGILCLYLAEGAAGFPVFQPLGFGGLTQVLGPTGGFLLAYPFVAALTGWLSRVIPARSRFIANAAAGLGGITLLFALGAARLGTLLHLNVQTTMLAAVVPFVPGELVKVCAAAGIASAWQRRNS